MTSKERMEGEAMKQAKKWVALIEKNSDLSTAQCIHIASLFVNEYINTFSMGIITNNFFFWEEVKKQIKKL